MRFRVGRYLVNLSWENWTVLEDVALALVAVGLSLKLAGVDVVTLRLMADISGN